MPRTPGRKGALPNDPAKPRINLGRAIRGTAPLQAHWGNNPVIGMLGNDTLGDCVDAAGAHWAQAVTFYGQGRETEVPLAQVLTMYEAAGGYDPAQVQPDGSNPTDNGSSLQAGMEYLVSYGLAGVKAAAFGEMDIRDTNSWQQALAEMGPLYLGVGVGDYEQQAFGSGQVWDVQPGAANPEDHCVLLTGYQPGTYWIQTWGGVQGVTPAWFSRNSYEVWGIASPWWVSKVKGTDPAAVNLAAFGAQFAALTGQPDPFRA